MKRKSPKPYPVTPEQIRETARIAGLSSTLADGPVQEKARLAKCYVCGSEAAGSGEPLCWVCRRLKISAWRDIEQQMPMQE